MSDGFLAFKGFAWGAAALFVGAALLPTATSGKFDPLRRLRAEELAAKATGRLKESPRYAYSDDAYSDDAYSDDAYSDDAYSDDAYSDANPTPTTSAGGFPEITTLLQIYDQCRRWCPSWGTGRDPTEHGVRSLGCVPLCLWRRAP